MSPSSTVVDSREFHHSLIVIDALEHSRWDRELFDEVRRGGLTAIHVTLAVWEDARTTLDTVARWRRHFREYGDLIMPATSAAEIELAKARDRTAIIFGFQNASPLEDDLGLVEVFHALGVRIIQLTYNNQSLVGGGCYEKQDGGLTRFGRQVVREMNRLGMLIDLSHCGERTTLDAIEASERPVAITHSHSKAFHNSLRNKSTDLLRALARSGGMLGLSLYPFHIGGAGCTLERYCEGVQHAVEIMGIDQVGFGSDSSRKWTDADLDWIRSGRWTNDVDFGEGSAAQRSWPRWPDWFQSPAHFPVLTEGLLARGFTREEVAKLVGGNWLRVFAAAFTPGGGGAN